jgi:formylmethanofuran dehydrogenase subunit E
MRKTTDEEPGYQDKYPSFEACVRFHGHTCPGLATGYRVATTAMRTLGVKRPYDEELVCIAETDACGVDAIQMVTGCTAGKGNLAIRDYGKHAFTFISRDSGRGIRILVRRADSPDRAAMMDNLRKRVFSGKATAGEPAEYRSLMEGAAARILAAPEKDILDIREVRLETPKMASIFTTITCASCGEPVADARTSMVDGLRVCIPCSEMLSGKGGRPGHEH